jgi:hypothetical protein
LAKFVIFGNKNNRLNNIRSCDIGEHKHTRVSKCYHKVSNIQACTSKFGSKSGEQTIIVVWICVVLALQNVNRIA